MKVLFCTDGSKISYHSIQNFSHWSKEFTVDIICVIDWSFLPDTVAIEDSEFAVQCANSADSILEYTESYLRETGMNVGRKIKICGSTVDAILDIADSSEYDFIVLGSHGKKGIQKWLGSVSQEIASVAKFSTYISKDRNARKKVLFTLDSSDLSVNVVKKAIDTLDLDDKDIYLLTVYEIPDYLFLEGNVDANWILEIEKKQEQAASILLNNFEKILCENNLTVKSKVILKGIPSQEIIKYSNKENIDLIVSGIRNRKHLSKFLLGSVSKRVLENVNSDVLIVRF
ncbi:universal stress protein [bacterium]|nr:universal stress protein [bacterium]